MSWYQRTLIFVLTLLAYSCYTELVVTGRLTEYVLDKQWIWIGDNLVFIFLWASMIFCGFSTLICLDTEDKNLQEVFNEMYNDHPNSNKMHTSTWWVFVPLALVLIQYELYYQLTFTVGFGATFAALHFRYEAVCKSVKQVELTEQAKAGTTE